jgi:hypothetical protein
MNQSASDGTSCELAGSDGSRVNGRRGATGLPGLSLGFVF